MGFSSSNRNPGLVINGSYLITADCYVVSLGNYLLHLHDNLRNEPATAVALVPLTLVRHLQEIEQLLVALIFQHVPSLTQEMKHSCKLGDLSCTFTFESHLHFIKNCWAIQLHGVVDLCNNKMPAVLADIVFVLLTLSFNKSFIASVFLACFSKVSDLGPIVTVLPFTVEQMTHFTQ
jgi:hypothetical protein